jgi:RND family efflux transporter MFP subunit
MRIYLLFLTSMLYLSPVYGDASVVQSSEVHYRPYAKQIYVSGKLSNKAEQRLSFKIQGVIQAIHVDEGQRVSAGQLLASLDQAEITAQVRQAKSVYENSNKNMQRFSSLYRDKVITLEQVQAAQTHLDIARSDLQIAQFNQKHAQIRATSDGLVLKRLVEKNELANPNQTAFIISNENRGWVLRVGVTDRDLVRIETGNVARLKLDAYPQQEISGQVSEIAAAADPQSGLFEVEIHLNAPTMRLYSGFIASANIHSKQSVALAFLPGESMVSANGRNVVLFIINNKRQAEKRQAQLAFILGDQIAIRAGLEEGEKVVSNGAAYLRNGDSVEIASVH